NHPATSHAATGRAATSRAATGRAATSRAAMTHAGPSTRPPRASNRARRPHATRAPRRRIRRVPPPRSRRARRPAPTTIARVHRAACDGAGGIERLAGGSARRRFRRCSRSASAAWIITIVVPTESSTIAAGSRHKRRIRTSPE
ncbi:MAG: hypothetical protein KA201_19475, partial [Kofleriaceae bacterium]|nr:hypothetical protein [Kofleriaceae bacterium]